LKNVNLSIYSATKDVALAHAFDGRTDRQTDRILIARPRLHSQQRGKSSDISPTLTKSYRELKMRIFG